MARIFISYARKDGSAVAEELADRLRAFEHEVFLDVHSIRAGTQWKSELLQRIHWAGVMIVLVTPASNESEHVRDEIAQAEQFGKVVIPIQVSDAPMPEHLRSKWQSLKLDHDNYDRVLLEIEHTINRLPRQSRLPLMALIGIGLLALVVIAVIGSGILQNRTLQPSTVTPTLMTPASEGTIYVEDFEDGEADGWEINWGNAFSVADDGTGNQVWRSAADGEMFYEPSLGWRDFSIQLRYYVAEWDTAEDDTGFLVGIRRMADQECNRYGFYFNQEFIVMDATDQACDTIEVFDVDDHVNAPGQWHDFYVEARGTDIQWRVDDGELHEISDDTYSAGSLAILNLHASEFWFDDIRIQLFDR